MGNVRSRDARKSRFRYINGRRYHNDKNSKYFLPNDDEEGNFSSPMNHLFEEGGVNALDIGCGPGAWVLNMSIDYPKSTFVGIDISPIFPSEIKPNNLTFLTCNLLDGLPFHDENFDYIHVRFLMTAFTEDEWKNKVIPELMRVIKRNGWVELMDGEVIYNVEGERREEIQCEHQYQNDEILHPNLNLNLNQNNENKFITVIKAFESTLISNNINPKLKDLLSILLENRLNNCKSIKNLSYQERIVLIGDHNNDNCILEDDDTDSYKYGDGDGDGDEKSQITTTSSTSTSPNNSLSELLLQDIVQFMNSLKPLLIRVLNLNEQNEFDILVEQFIKDIYENNYFYCSYRYYFQKI
ncbi:5714_t:CDS:2 [Entrophospora sp. SA101]|nr:2966_t:CDS:2 [Entrophospora sp. SA101]CAJ0646944.1 5714_t:CDS:2 [Entrophospora sp. SA101]